MDLKAIFVETWGRSGWIRKAARVCVPAAAVWMAAMSAAWAGELPDVAHHLEISLDPARGSLTGRDRMSVTLPPDTAYFHFDLSPLVRITMLTVEGKRVPVIRQGNRVRVPVPHGPGRKSLDVEVRYEGRFADPFPENPVNTDNPGFGVLGTISGKGACLLAGAGWYPLVSAESERFRVRVSTPRDWKALTAGDFTGFSTEDGRTVSTWDVRQPVRGLHLQAGPYEVRERKTGDVTAAVWLFSESMDLAETYLDAVARYVGLFSGQFGKYPFSRFTVVENFFPTGYGFASYTLLGTRVLRLPFIPYTSLPHEIAHCWWGNGVWTGPGGNWSEGLTSYVADYGLKEMQGPEQARDHRRQWRYSYALLAGDADFSLSRFTSRTDPATRAVGYDKGAMVFHMLRNRIGDDAFSAGLRKIFAERLFLAASWKDFEASFESVSGQDLSLFFRQWVRETGAPRVTLADVSIGPGVVRGVLETGGTLDRLDVELVLTTRTGERRTAVSVQNGRTPFEIQCDGAPVRLEVDPDANLMLRLLPEEVPPSVNSLKGSDSLALVPPDDPDPEIEKAAAILLRGLGQRPDRIWAASRAAEELKKQGPGMDVLYIGWPGDAGFAGILPAGVRVSADRFVVRGTEYGRGAALFAVFGRKGAPGRTAGLFLPLSGAAASTVARKIGHYGRYGCLAFDSGVNREKIIWPVLGGGMVHDF